MAVKEDFTQWNEDMLGVRWEAQEEDLIGGWCVMPEGSSPPTEGGLEVATFVTEELAEHIAMLHNDWLDARERIREAVGLKHLSGESA